MTRRSARQQSLVNRARYADLPPVTGRCIARVLHDRECSMPRGSSAFPYLSRFYDQNKTVRGLPETVRYTGGPGNVLLRDVWQTFWADHNTPEAITFTLGKKMPPNTGWNNAGWPRIEQLLFGGDFVRVLEKRGDMARIQTYHNLATPAPLVDGNGEEYNLLNEFSVVYTDDTLSLAPCGHCYSFPISAKSETCWMDVRNLTYLRELP